VDHQYHYQLEQIGILLLILIMATAE